MSFGELEHNRDQGSTLSGAGQSKILGHAFTTRAMHGASPQERIRLACETCPSGHFFTLAVQRQTSRDALSLRVAYEREETLGIRCGPLPAEGTRVARCSEICIRLASRQPRIRTHYLVNSRAPEALISHDSAAMQSTSVAAQF